jgi:hypothetical protein
MHLLHVAGHRHLLEAGDLPHPAEVLAEPAHHLLHEQELLHQLVHGSGFVPEPLAMRVTRWARG